jgi:hypothetical protein
MECDRIKQEIEQALAAGTPFTGPLAEHLAACPPCRAYAAGAAETDARIIAATRLAEPRPPEDLHDRLMQAVAREALPTRPQTRRHATHRVAATLMAAAAIILIMLAFRTMHNTPTPADDIALPPPPAEDFALLATVAENIRALDPRHVARETARPFRELAMAVTSTVTSPFRTIQPDNPTGP